MKKILLTLTAIYALVSVNRLNAQIATIEATPVTTFVTHYETPDEKNTNDANIDVHAANHFKKNFTSAENVNWTKVSDGFIAYFTQNAVVSRVAYDRKGKWAYTIYEYYESGLPESVRTDVKTAFGNYNITKVEEVHTNNKVIYLIHINNASTLKMLRVCNNEIEVIENYKQG